MSRVRNVQLTITQQPNTDWRVEVTYEARFSNVEVGNIQFRERITLLGQDQFLNMRVQFEELEVFQNNILRPTSRSQTINRAFIVSGNVLDEDDGSEVAGVSFPEISSFNNPTDEVLAQVELIPQGVSRGRGRSAVVRDNF